MQTKAINFRYAELTGVNLQPTEDGPKAVLLVTARLTPQLAEKIGRKEMFYDEKGVARDFDSCKLPLIVRQFDLIAEYSGEAFDFRPEKARGFIVTRSTGKGDDTTQIELSFRVHVASENDVDHAFSLFRTANKEEISVKLTSQQGELFAAAEEEDAEEKTPLDDDGQEPPNTPVLATMQEMEGRRRVKGKYAEAVR